MSEWSFQRKVITTVIAVCLMAIVTSGASLVASRTLIFNMTQLSAGENLVVSGARELQVAGVRNIAVARASLLPGGRDLVPAARLGNANVLERIGQLRARITDSATVAALDDIEVGQRAHEDAFERALDAPATPRGGPAPLETERLLLSAERLDRSLAALTARLESDRAALLGPRRAAAERSQVLLIGITLTTIALLLVLCLFLIAGLSRSYRKQATARTAAEQGQTQARVSLSEVEAASHVKDEFLATVSHELRNPLAPILTWTQLLRSGTLDEAKTRRALEVIERNVMSQAQLIDDLVDVSRVVSGKFRLDVRPLDLAPVIRAAAESQVPASDAKNIRLQLVLDERAGLVSGDSERLQQVMWNLISNAIKFTPKGGRVQVVLQRAESHVEIAVSDSGVGIAPEFLPHVFEPFKQGSGGSMRRHGGLGLGLSIVRHIVELHGGEITAFSAGEGLGSKFTINLPLLATSGETGEPVRRHPIARDHLADLHLTRLVGTRVLVVDDEPSASEALLVLFQSCGAEARVAGSVSEAIRTFESWRPDVVVSDIAMPVEDGYALLRRIRGLSSDRGGNTPAVALTAYAKIEDRVAILAAGFQMYLSKPADPNELVAVVSSLTRKRGIGEDQVVS